MDDPIWSRHFALQVAHTLGYRVPARAASGSIGEVGTMDFNADAQKVADELTELFRHMPPEQIQCALDFAEFLRTHKVDGSFTAIPQSWVLEKVREVRDLALYLRQRYGREQPADEKDYWTAEDEREMSRLTWQRLEVEDPWPEGDRYKEQGNAQSG